MPKIQMIKSDKGNRVMTDMSMPEFLTMFRAMTVVTALKHDIDQKDVVKVLLKTARAGEEKIEEVCKDLFDGEGVEAEFIAAMLRSGALRKEEYSKEDRKSISEQIVAEGGDECECEVCKLDRAMKDVVASTEEKPKEDKPKEEAKEQKPKPKPRDPNLAINVVNDGKRGKVSAIMGIREAHIIMASLTKLAAEKLDMDSREILSIAAIQQDANDIVQKVAKQKSDELVSKWNDVQVLLRWAAAVSSERAVGSEDLAEAKERDEFGEIKTNIIAIMKKEKD